MRRFDKITEKKLCTCLLTEAGSHSAMVDVDAHDRGQNSADQKWQGENLTSFGSCVVILSLDYAWRNY